MPGKGQIWDEFVRSDSRASLYQLHSWHQVISGKYGHDCYCLVAINEGAQHRICHLSDLSGKSGQEARIAGILPLVHLKSFLFGNDLISIPFFDMGGILADDERTEKVLLQEAVRLGQKLKASSIQLRQTTQLLTLPQPTPTNSNTCTNSTIPDLGCVVQTRINKARMILDLPESADALMSSFKSKLRSQIRKPSKEGLVAKIGGIEFLDDFYEVFAINMRDLGSPVHSKSFIAGVIEQFSTQSRICIVYGQGRPLACSIIIGFKNMLHNPWASSLREYSKLSPNMLLYWTMLQYACESGYSHFDFGRSSVDESTYKFKEQWGAKPQSLFWYYVCWGGKPLDTDASEKSKFGLAVRVWQKIPVFITKLVGPPVRKHIGL